MSLEDVIIQYEDLRQSYKFHLQTEFTRESLLEYQGRFTETKANLRPFYTEIVRNHTFYDDKAATAKKYRVCIDIVEGRLKREDGSLVYPQCSINQAEKYAAGSDTYIKFIEKRAFWKESLVNINSLRDDINSYLIEISNRLK